MSLIEDSCIQIVAMDVSLIFQIHIVYDHQLIDGVCWTKSCIVEEQEASYGFDISVESEYRALADTT